MKIIAMMAVALTVGAHAAITPIPDTVRARDDGWERDMLFFVANEPEVDDSYVRFAVTGCAQRKGYIVAIEQDDEAMSEQFVVEWRDNDGQVASRLAALICEGS